MRYIIVSDQMEARMLFAHYLLVNKVEDAGSRWYRKINFHCYQGAHEFQINKTSTHVLTNITNHTK